LSTTWGRRQPSVRSRSACRPGRFRRGLSEMPSSLCAFTISAMRSISDALLSGKGNSVMITGPVRGGQALQEFRSKPPPAIVIEPRPVLPCADAAAAQICRRSGSRGPDDPIKARVVDSSGSSIRPAAGDQIGRVGGMCVTPIPTAMPTAHSAAVGQPRRHHGRLLWEPSKFR